MNKNMIRAAVIVTSLVLAGRVLGATDIFGSYIGINAGSGNNWYGAEEWGTNDLTNFQGANLGTFDITASPSLQISAFEVHTSKSGTGDVTGAEMQYRVYEQNSTPGSFNTVNGFFLDNATFTSAAGNTASSFGDQNWGVDPTETLGNLLLNTEVDKTYNVEIFFRAFTNEGDRFSNNGGSNYIASFTVIPEPSSIIMIGLVGLAAGGLTVLKRRKRG